MKLHFLNQKDPLCYSSHSWKGGLYPNNSNIYICNFQPFFKFNFVSIKELHLFICSHEIRNFVKNRATLDLIQSQVIRKFSRQNNYFNSILKEKYMKYKNVICLL